MLHFIQSSNGHPLTEAQAFFMEQRHRSKALVFVGAVLVLDVISLTLTVLAS